jgi:thiopeptide-type bacteriocin biosynthesis protein
LFDPLDWVLVRAPLLPVEAYLALTREPPSGDGEPHKPANAQAAPHTGMPTDPRIRAALAVGSPSLYEALTRADRSGKHDPDTAAKLLRYLIRMSTRPTPYGLFAGVALASWGPRTDLALASGRPRTCTRPDMAWLLRLVFELETRPEVRTHLRYVTNAAALVRAGRVFLTEAAPAKDGGGSGPVSVRASNVVLQALAMARTPVSHEHLVAELAKAPGATAEKAEKLIEGLWRQTFLLSDLRPPLTQANPAAYIARRLRDVPAAADVLEQLTTVLSAMAEWDGLPIEKAASAYQRLVMHPEGEEPAGTDASQVDMALTLKGDTLTRAVAYEGVRAAELLLRMAPLPAGLPYLDGYRRLFVTRYGSEREVPILELLDPNFGLGPPSPQFHGGGQGGDPRKAAVRQQTLYDLAITALRERNLVVELDEKTLARLESWTPSSLTAPESLDLSLFVVAASAANVDAGRFQVVVGPNLGASAAGRNLGRFAPLLEEKAAAALEQLGRAELAHHPDNLCVELVYLPRRFRSANVSIRPHPRRYEIVVGTTAGLDPDRVIPLDELVVGVRNDRFYLRWPAHDAHVIGCAGHMLNNMQAPAVCRFIDDMRRDGQAQFSSFDWGSAAGLPVLPRVQVGRVVLSLARWLIGARLRSELSADSAASFGTALRKWRTRWQVPRYVYLSFGDNRLILDLDDEAQAEELRLEIRRLTEGSQILLQEALPTPEQAWFEGQDGRYITELIVPLVLRPGQNPAAEGPNVSRDTNRSRGTSPIPAVARADRLRAPGSDWLFVKLYAPRIFEDDLLTGPMAELCQQALATGAADDWFFIRYADPDPHIRLRFQGQPERLTGELVPYVCKWANDILSDGLGARLSFDTYDREIERFGGTAGTAAAEAIFGADSRAVIEMLRLLRAGLLDMDMTSLAVLSIDSLLAGLGSSEASLVWYREKVTSRKAAGEECRRKTNLRHLLGDPEQLRSHPGGAALAQVLATRRDDLATISSKLDALAAANELFQPRSAFVRTCVHLHCNRLLGANQLTEVQILDLLGRTRQALEQAPFSRPARGVLTAART